MLGLAESTRFLLTRESQHARAAGTTRDGYLDLAVSLLGLRLGLDFCVAARLLFNIYFQLAVGGGLGGDGGKYKWWFIIFTVVYCGGFPIEIWTEKKRKIELIFCKYLNILVLIHDYFFF